MSSRSVSRATTILVAATLACAGHAPLPVTGPLAPTPVAAALRAFWAYQRTEQPSHLAINIPAGTPVDTTATGGLLSQSVRVTLFGDSSRYNAAKISADSQRVLGTVYDVRLIPEAAWDSMVAADSNLLAGVELHGAVYHVSREWCRGWPCHDGNWVDVRRQGHRYRGVVFAWWVE